MSEESVAEPVDAPAPVEAAPPPSRPIITKLRVFIILSAGVHLGFCVCWGVPAYVKHKAELAAIEEEKRVALQLKEAEKRGREETKRQSIEATKKEVAEVLKQDFDKIVQKDLGGSEKDKVWQDVVKGIDDKLTNYANDLSSSTASDADLESKLTDMKGAMVTELEQDLRGTAVKDLADEFVSAIDRDVVPKLADDYHKNIERAVGVPLQQSGAAIVRDEKNLVDRERADLKNALEGAVKQAERARDDLTAAKDRIKNADTTGSQTVKDANERETALVKGEEPGIEQAENQIKSAIDGVAKAAEKVPADVKDKINKAVKGDGDAAEKEVGDAKNSSEKGDGKATRQHVAAAGDAAKKVDDAIAQIKGAIDSSNADPKDKQAAKSDLDNAKKQADAAVAGLKGIGDRIGRAENATAQAGKTSEAQTGRVVANEGKTIAQAENELKDAETKLGKAAEKAGAFGEDLQNQISGAANTDGKAAEGKIGAAKQAAKDGKLDDLASNVSDAADAAKKLADSTTAARDAADKAQFDPSALARAVIKDMKDGEIKGAMDQAFKKDFENNAVPRLTQKLGDAFQNSLSKDGIQDDATVAEVRAKINELLKSKVPALAHAGDASTDPLDKGENLGNAQAGDNKNAARAKAVSDKVKKAVDGLVGKNMADVTNDGKEDDVALGIAGTDLAAAQGPGHHGKHGKGANGGTDGGTGADGEGNGEGGGNLAGLLARVQNLSKNVKAGRMGFLEGNGGADGEDDGAGGGGLAGKKSGGTGGGAGAGNGLGGGGNGPDGPGGPGGIAGLRQHALSRGPGNGRGHGNGMYYFNKEEHAKLTEGIRDRDQAAAQGEVFERKGAEGEVSTAESIKDRLSYGLVLVPPVPTGDVAGVPAQKDPYKPKFATKYFAAIPFLREPLKIDGDMAKWKDIPAVPMHKQLDGGAGSLKIVEPQFAKMAWDNTGLYFCYDVKDADNQITKTKPGTFWEADAVEIFFDARNTKDKERGSKWTQQFWVWPFGMAGDDAIVGGEAVFDEKGNLTEPLFKSDRVQRVANKTADGWTMEVHLPFDMCKNFSAQPGRIIGVNLSICTGTPLYYYWAGTSAVRTSEHPDTWGDLLLAGCDGKLEVVDKLSTELKAGETSKPSATLAIGDPLKIRITDADMNLSDKRRDKLAVTVKARGSGEVKVVTLEETGEKTGIFEGAIRTNLNLGDTDPKTLALFEGEAVDVIYLDQARANGARNVEVKLTLKSSAGVYTMASTAAAASK
jgi:hypothetical protein